MLKRKKLFLFIFVLCALLCMGLGYATLVDTLVIDGNVGITGENVRNEEVFNVVFDLLAPINDPKVNDLKNGTSTAIKVTENVIDESTAVINISNFAVCGEYVINDYYVLNQSKNVTGGYDANVDIKVYIDSNLYSPTDDNCPFTIDWYFVDIDNLNVVESLNTSTVIEFGKEKQLFLKVEMKNVLITTAKDYTIKIVLDATAVQ